MGVFRQKIREVENKEQTVRGELRRGLHNKEQTDRKILDNFERDWRSCKQGANRSKGLRDLQKKEQTARMRLEIFEKEI